ncbi:MAG: IS1 family transposase [Bacilli bacterium]|nr:IS1 family transposase [Bacilli bacterium]
MPDRKTKPYHPRRFPEPGEGADPIESFVVDANNDEYASYHSGTSQDAGLLNSAAARKSCPYCGSASVESKGRTKTGSRRLRCRSCGKSFVPTTEGLLSYHKLPVKTIARFLVNVLTDASVNEASKVAKISMRTAVYWMNKAFLALRGYQDSLVLAGCVYLDDKFIDVEASKKVAASASAGLQMPSANQWNVAIGKAGRVRVLILQGKGVSSDRRLRKTWSGRIGKGCRLVTDGSRAYHLVAEDCAAVEWRRIKFEYRHGNQCPELKPINVLSSNVEAWFRLHCGMVKTASRIQDYLNLLSFKLTCPGNALKKAETLLRMMLASGEKLRFREKMPEISRF